MTSLKSDDLKRFLLLYGSQTGQAKAIAEEIADSAPLHGLKADLHCLSLMDKRFCIENESYVVFIVATTGDGEAPDTAVKFYRRICRHTLKNNFLEKLNYAILALGDSNYIKFCLFGRLLERRLKTLSAKPFFEIGFGDDAFGIETGVDPWIQNLWPALQKHLHVESVSMNGYSLEYDNKESHLIESNKDISKNSNISPMALPSDKEAQILTISDLSSFLKDFNVEKCRVPKLPSPILDATFLKDMDDKIQFVPGDSNLNSQASPLSKVKLISTKMLTSSEDVKQTLELEFQFQDAIIEYMPGDSFGFICPNPLDEVEMLLERLNVLHLAEKPVNLQISQASVNKRKLPAHIPSLLSLMDVFLHCIEIRSVPKKILLRVLAEYTTNIDEKDSLLFLSSPEGSKVYTNCIRKPSLSILDILLHYTSCTPPVGRILEYLPCLKPRFYSVASSPLTKKTCFKIVFNVLKIDKDEGRLKDREGVCTGWLRRLSSELQNAAEKNLSSLPDQMSALNINCDKFSLCIYKRTNQHFCLPKNLDCPIIMIGPGTGIAPFIGFLQHREKQVEMNEDGGKASETWLFYGCRYKEKDFLYKTELHRLQSIGVLTHLIVSLSRESMLPSDVTSKYVYESIKHHASALADAVQAGGKIFVCGDAKHMAHDVQQAFIEAFQTSLGLSQIEAKSFVEKLQEEHRYINDIWA